MPVIYLEADDEITSAAARLRAAAAGPVALVLPAGSHLASSRINFRLLAREASARAQALAIVAPEPATRALAVAAGLAAYGTVREYEAAVAEGAAEGAVVPEVPPEREAIAEAGPEGAPSALGGRSAGALPVVKAEPRPGRGRRRRGWLLAALALLLAAGAGGGAGAYLLVPEARIVVTPRSETVGPVSLAVTADPQAGAIDEAAGVVPAERVGFPLEVQAGYPASGVRVDETKSSGTVTFTNLDPTAGHVVPVGATVRTPSGIAFVTRGIVELPKAGLEGVTIIPTARDAAVEAAEAGPEGNVPALAISVIPSNLDPVVVRVANKAATAGGSRTEVKLVAREDYDAAVADLQAKLETAFQAQLDVTATTPEGARIFRVTGRLGDATFDPEPATVVDSETETFELTARATGRATAVDLRLLERLGAGSLRAALPEGLTLLEGSVTVEWSTAAAPEPSQVAFTVTARGSGYREVDAAAVRAAVLGRPLDEARSVLAGFGEVSVELTPDWFGRIPPLDFRVRVEVVPVPGAP